MIEGFKKSDREAVISIFQAISDQTGGNYPSSIAVEKSFKGSIEKWIGFEKKSERFVFRKSGVIVGHVEIEKASNNPNYFGPAFVGSNLNSIAVLKRLAVFPNLQGQGIGGRLLSFAVLKIIKEGLTPGLVVLEYLDQAQGFYEKRGWEHKGNFQEEIGVKFKVYLWQSISEAESFSGAKKLIQPL